MISHRLFFYTVKISNVLFSLWRHVMYCMQCLRFERNMLKNKGNVINRKIIGLNCIKEFISLVRQDFLKYKISKSCLVCEINSICNVKPPNTLSLYIHITLYFLHMYEVNTFSLLLINHGKTRVYLIHLKMNKTLLLPRYCSPDGQVDLRQDQWPDRVCWPDSGTDPHGDVHPTYRDRRWTDDKGPVPTRQLQVAGQGEGEREFKTAGYCLMKFCWVLRNRKKTLKFTRGTLLLCPKTCTYKNI